MGKRDTSRKKVDQYRTWDMVSVQLEDMGGWQWVAMEMGLFQTKLLIGWAN